MSIEFHCDHCGKLVRAPREAGGKRSACPSCGQDLYVPTPREELEELELAPLDEANERQRERIRREEQQFEQQLREEATSQEPPGEGKNKPKRNLDPVVSTSPGELERRVLAYVQAMVEQKLDQAERILQELSAESSSALSAVDRLAEDDAALGRFSGVPRLVVLGFLGQLREQLA